jgi:hypothetical protein
MVALFRLELSGEMRRSTLLAEGGERLPRSEEGIGAWEV